MIYSGWRIKMVTAPVHSRAAVGEDTVKHDGTIVSVGHLTIRKHEHITLHIPYSGVFYGSALSYKIR